MKTDVLFVHHQLAFAVSIKQALERTGSYDVHPFTSVEAALEYLRGHTQDVALVDFMMPVYSGEEIVERLRQVQAQIAVVATPTQTEAEFVRVGLQGMLNATFTAREFIPVIERALEGRRTGELPTPAQKAGLLDRVQPDSDTGSSAPEKRPPTSVIGYRSLESILDQGAAALPPEPEPQADAPTLVEGLPAARPVDDLSFLNDVTPSASAAPEVRINTERLADMDKFKSDEFPELVDEPRGVSTDSFKGVTEPLPDDLFDLDEDEVDTPSSARPPAQPYGAPPEPLKRVTELLPEESFDFDEDMFAEPPAVPVMAEDVPWSEGGSGTRPLPDLEFEDEAEMPGQAAADAGLESLSSKLRERDLFGTRPLEDADDAAYDLFGEPQIDVLAGFEDAEALADEDEQDTPDQPVDYMAALDLKPPAPAEAHEPPPAAPVPEPSEEEVVAGLVALFDNPSADAPAEPELSFEELLRATGQNEDEFADVLGEIAPGEAAARERSPFDDLVASMSAPEQRPPLPARQQQYVDAPLAGETAERGNEEAAPELEDFPFEDEVEDGSAVLFEDDEAIGGDAPSEPAAPVLADELPEPASPEELAALFAAPRFGEASAPPPEPDFEALFTDQPAESEADFEALFVELAPAAEDDFEEARDAGEAAAAEPDFEALFSVDEQPKDEQPDFDSMFGEAEVPHAAPFPPGMDLYGGDWQASERVEVDLSASFEDTGTVSDLMTGVGGVTSGRSGMLTRLDSDLPVAAPEKPGRASAATTAAPLPAIDDSVTALLAEIELQLMAAPPPAASIAQEISDDSGDTPARRILATTSEAELSDSSFSVDNLIDNIEAQMPPNQAKVQPLPSWLRTPPPAPLPPLTLAEEAFAPMGEMVAHDAAPAIEEEPPFDWEAATFDDTTVMGEAARLEQFEATGDEETSWLELIGPEGSAAEETLVAGATALGASNAAASWNDIPADSEAELEAEAEALQAEHIDDPYIAQLALSLTDVSLELTADAVLLTRERDIAAFAGRMDRAELLELRHVIDDDWQAASGDARIRFLRLPDSGKDVMLYSRRTVEDLTLSLVFDGTMPLRDIRQQGKRLTDALAAVPETPIELVLPIPLEDEQSAEQAPAIPRSPHAYVWLLRDPDAVLARPVAQAMLSGLHQQLHEHGWRVREIRASDDHIYLLADSPDEQPPYVAVRELMRRSAHIAHVQNPGLDVKSLWADAYLVVTPGRSLEQDEIQQFIQFERML